MSRRANGEGTIFRRQDGRWCAQVYLTTTNGRRKRVIVYGRTRPEVREKMTALQRDMDRGIRVPEEKWSVAGYLAHWLEHVVKPQQGPEDLSGL